MHRLIQRTQLPSAGVWLLAATFITTVGNGMHTFAVGKLLYDQTGSVAAFGTVLILEQVASFLTQFIAGPWVDRGSPRRTGVQVELLRGLCICLASLMLGGENMLGWIMLMTLVIRVAHPFYRAAMFALAPSVVPGNLLARYNGLSNMSLQSGQLLGLVLAAPVFDLWGPAAAFLLNGITFLFSAAAVWLLRLPPAEGVAQGSQGSPPRPHLLKDWHEILVLLRHEAGLKWHLVLSTTSNLIIYLYNLVEVALVTQRYGSNPYWLSVIGCLIAVGAMAGVPLIAPLTSRWGARSTVASTIGGQGLCFVALGVVADPWLTLALVFMIGGLNTIGLTVLTTTLQLRVGTSVKGRIGTARNLLTTVMIALLLPVVSRIEAISLAWALLAAGAICLVFATIAVIFGRPQALGKRLLGELPETNRA